MNELKDGQKDRQEVWNNTLDVMIFNIPKGPYLYPIKLMKNVLRNQLQEKRIAKKCPLWH